MKTTTQTRVAIVAVLLLGGATLAQAQDRAPRGNAGARSGGGGRGAAGVTRSFGGSHSGSKSGGARSVGHRGTAYRVPGHRSTGSAGVSRRVWSDSSVRTKTPVYRPPSTGERPPSYRPSYPIHGRPPQWGWSYWTWPYHYSYGFWGGPPYWTSAWRPFPFYWGPSFWGPSYWGPGSWGPAYGSAGYWGAPGYSGRGYSSHLGNAYLAPVPYATVRPDSEGWRERLEPAIRGGLDLKIKPRKTQVWIDGVYAGLAKDFDGYPSYLWLNGGSHSVSFYLPGYETVTRGVDVRPGKVGTMKTKLSRGESGPPPAPPSQP